MHKLEDIPYIHRYYDVILQDDLTFNKIKEKYPELEIDLLSSKDNPNCECKNRVITYLTVKLNIKDDEIFLRNLIENKRLDEQRKIADQNWEFIIGENEIKTTQYSAEYAVADKIYRVNKSDESWKDFVTKIRASLIFQSFSVVDKGDYLEVYFL